ncbi:hypothetical protein [uncultured Umboniibacter sp.]|uniref:competence protein CoiA family protein n=1 Tax=uncultured Umboniibacter sp. TaxID=1798917 RepID=UPI002619F7C5|nr:hypothetical protein [uncultured Umboniibacter sp.]
MILLLPIQHTVDPNNATEASIKRMELLIPFGIHRDTAKYIDPSSPLALNGRRCNCVCPSCRAPLLMRHPTGRIAHFAHDSKHPDAIPNNECDLSPAVAIAMMTRYLAKGWEGEVFSTPQYEKRLHLPCCNTTKTLLIRPAETQIIQRVTLGNTGAGEPDLKVVNNDGQALHISLSYLGRDWSARNQEAMRKSAAHFSDYDLD